MKYRALIPIAITLLLPTILAASGTGDAPAVKQDEFWTIKIGDVIMIGAVFLAPIFALWAQWRLQLRHEKRQGRLKIYTTLMATRQTALDIEHVKALNMIDVVFSGGDFRDREIRAAWGSYLAQLNIPVPPPGPANQNWETQRVDLLSMLLSKIGKSLDFDFEFTDYKNKVYHPSGLADNTNEMIEIRQRWLALLKGDQALKMDVTSLPPQFK